MEVDNQTDNFPENSCLICYNEVDKIIILCKNCKYLYCDKCANQIKFSCAICNRLQNKVTFQEVGTHPLHNTFYASIFFFIFSLLFYILVFGLFSYYIFINYSPYYKFILYARNNGLIEQISKINHSIVENDICYKKDFFTSQFF